MSDAPGALWIDTPYADPNFVYRGTPTSSLSFQHTSNRRYDITGALVYTDDGNANHSMTMTNASSTGYSRPSAITTANSLNTGFTWHTMLAPLSRTGWNSDVDSTTYDVSTARPATKTSPYGAVTHYSYSNTAPQIMATTDNRWEKTYLDGLGRPIRTERGDNGTTRSVMEMVYDTCGCTPIGKLYRQSMPHAPGATAVWNTYTYDAIGRRLTAVKPDGQSTTTYSYAGAAVTVTDPSGQWKKLTRDSFGQLVKVEEPSPNAGTEPNHITLYTYDVLGHLTKVQMDRTIGGTVRTQYRTWVYDPNTQLMTSKTTPEAGTVSYTYNADRTLATKTDAKNQRTVYTYDNYGRVIQIARGTVSGGVFTETIAERTTFAYEGTNGGYSAATKGRVSQVTYNGPHGTSFVEMYSYHNGGRVTKKRVQITGTPFGSSTVTMEAGYTYDNEGRTTSIQYPSSQINSSGTTTAGLLYTYGYDALGRLNQMTDNASTTWVSAATYGPADEMLTMTANGFSETRTYNANLQLTQLTSGTGVQRKYNYSATQNNGQIVSQQDLVSGETISYQYDSLKRLIQASATGDPSGAWSQNFAYDGFGNLTTKTSTNAPQLSVAVDSATNRIQSFSTYDANGNLTGYAGDGYSYDLQNRMIQATVSGVGTVQYGYDTTNHRVYKGAYSSGTYSAEEFYFYGVEGHQYGTWKINPSSGVLLQASVTKQWFGARLVSPEDRLGSKGRYFAFGEERTNITPANPSNDQEKFATYTRDAATGLDYANQRYFSSTIARFTKPDPYEESVDSADPQSWNRYSYSENDPVKYGDPLGLYLTDPDFDQDPFAPVPPSPGDCGEFSGYCYEPSPYPPSPYPVPGPLYTWSLDVGYTPVLDLGGNLNEYNHLFIWVHPTGQQQFQDGVVFDGGPAQDCDIFLRCGNVTAWASSTGHYNELLNPAAVDFFTTVLGPSDNFRAGQISGQLLIDTLNISQSRVTPRSYDPAFGPNSNSVVYSLLQSVGIQVPISTINLPVIGDVGVLNYQINGQTQLFTRWGQNLLN